MVYHRLKSGCLSKPVVVHKNIEHDMLKMCNLKLTFLFLDQTYAVGTQKNFQWDGSFD